MLATPLSKPLYLVNILCSLCQYFSLGICFYDFYLFCLLFVLCVPGPPEPVRPKLDHFSWILLFGNDRYMVMVVITLLPHVQANKRTIASSKLKVIANDEIVTLPAQDIFLVKIL